MTKQLISSSETESVYRDRSTAIKKFCKGFPKAEVLNKALYNTRAGTIEALNVSRAPGVFIINDKWSITRELAEGKTLQQLMEENPDKTGEYLEQMIDLYLLIFAQICPLLNKLKEKTIRVLKSEEQLDENLCYELLTGLDGMSKHTKLCHGDFCLSNVIIDDDGRWYLVGWVHTSRGNAGTDMARTYLFLSLKDKRITGMYMDLFCVKTGTKKRYIQGWLPIVAAAQLAYKRPEEKELLENWTNVFDYQQNPPARGKKRHRKISSGAFFSEILMVIIPIDRIYTTISSS